MNNLRFTIFTPTYNRGYVLPRLYQSLKMQSIKNFEWLIVDDGSTDNTKSLVLRWADECRDFPVRYFYKENGGKPRAVNMGLNNAKGDYFVIVDSDDYLTSDAIQKFTTWVSDIEDNKSVVGIGAARGYSEKEYIKGVAPKIDDYIDITNLERGKYDLDADMVEAYRTEIFRGYPMAEWPGEKFAPEQISINEMALDGLKLRWHKDIVYICEYLEDGLTKGSFDLERKNPMGYAMMYNHMLRYGFGIKKNFKIACQMIALSIYGKHPEYILKSYKKLITIVAFPVGVILSFRRRKQFQG